MGSYLQGYNQAVNLYKDYWIDQSEERVRRNYYTRLYKYINFEFSPEWKILDVAGGNGQLSRYLGVKVDIIDISISGLEYAMKFGLNTIEGDIEKRFPLPTDSYDCALLFEVLEHLHKPNKTLSEIHNVLKPDGKLYISQPNMRPDGIYHVRRYTLKELIRSIKDTGFDVESFDYIPAYTMPEAILDDIKHNKSLARKCVQLVNLCLSLLPYKARYFMAKLVPDRFAMLFILKCRKIA